MNFPTNSPDDEPDDATDVDPGRLRQATVVSSRDQTGRLVRLCAKELREILRDRRTIVTLILMPLLVYPVLTMTFNSFLFSSFEEGATIQPIVAFESKEKFDDFQNWYFGWSQQLANDLPLDPAEDEPTVRFTDVADVRQQVEDNYIDLGVVISELPNDQRRFQNLPRIDVELIYREGSLAGEAAATFLQKRLSRVNASFDERVLAMGLPARDKVTTLKSESGFAFSFSSFVPLMLILMTITGAVYPAIDLTAGERERGTMEALIAAPVPRVGLLLAKYVAVLAVAVLTATANLVAMSITLLSSQLGNLLFGDGGVSWLVMAQVYGLMILFAAFFSAILLAVTSFARSFKEAQAYLIPLMLFSRAGDYQFDAGYRIDSSFLSHSSTESRPAFAGHDSRKRRPVDGDQRSLIDARLCSGGNHHCRENFWDGCNSLRKSVELVGLFRQPSESIGMSTAAGAMLCLALLFPLQFVASSLVGKLGDAPTSRVTIQIPKALETQARDRGLDVWIGNLPEDARLSQGTAMSPGDWRLSPTELDEVQLSNLVIGSKPISYSVSLMNDRGEPDMNGAQSFQLTIDQLMSGLSIGKRTLSLRLLGSAVATLLIFVGVPLISARWQRVRMAEGFRLHLPRWGAVVGVIILGLSLWPFAHDIVVLGLQLGLWSLEGKTESVERLIREFQSVSPFIVLFCLALTPAVCEEFFFRGFLLQSLQGRLRPWQSIAITAILFGAFHIIGSNNLAPERFLPSTFLGIALGWVCIKTGSVVPGMILHTIHNGFLLMIAYYRDELIDQGWNLADSSYVPLSWLGAAVIASIIGLMIVSWLGSSRKTPRMAAE